VLDEGPVIRLFTFRATRPAFDEILRDEMIPDLCALPGIIDCYSARQGPEELGPRVVATVWRTREAMSQVLGDDLDAGRFHPEYIDETTDRRVEVLPLAIERRFDASDSARILRILRGSVRPGEIPAYVEDVRGGVALDAARPDGPVSFYLALGPDAFITLSAWRSWPDIERATGGDVRRPRATSRPERLVEWDVQHFEIVSGLRLPSDSS
jgi:plasmid stabilization system protein ParE